MKHLHCYTLSQSQDGRLGKWNSLVVSQPRLPVVHLSPYPIKVLGGATCILEFLVEGLWEGMKSFLLCPFHPPIIERMRSDCIPVNHHRLF